MRSRGPGSGLRLPVRLRLPSECQCTSGLPGDPPLALAAWARTADSEAFKLNEPEESCGLLPLELGPGSPDATVSPDAFKLEARREPASELEPESRDIATCLSTREPLALAAAAVRPGLRGVGAAFKLLLPDP